MSTQAERLDRIDAASRRTPKLGGFSWTFFGIELKRLFSNYSVIIFTVIFPIGMLLLVGIPLNRQPAGDTGLTAAAPFMISMAVYGAMTAAAMTGVSVAAERGQGWSRQLRLTPLNPLVYILVKIGTGLVLGALTVAITVVAGLLMGITAPVANLVAGGVLAWLTSLSMTSLGLAVGYAFPAQNAMRYMGPLLPVLSFMGGLFVPLSTLPAMLQLAAKFTPVWGIADLAQSAVLGVPADPWAWANLVAWFALFTGLAVLMFRRDTDRV